NNTKLELAVEVGLWTDNLFFTAAWYRNRSGSQLVGIPMPGTTGFNSIQANLDATVENSGIEVELRSQLIRRRTLQWTMGLNLSLPENKLLSFPNLEGSTYANQLVIGKPLNIRKMYHYTGIDTATGIYDFEDIDGDGMITSPQDRTVIKDLNP